MNERRPLRGPARDHVSDLAQSAFGSGSTSSVPTAEIVLTRMIAELKYHDSQSLGNPRRSFSFNQLGPITLPDYLDPVGKYLNDAALPTTDKKPIHIGPSTTARVQSRILQARYSGRDDQPQAALPALPSPSSKAAESFAALVSTPPDSAADQAIALLLQVLPVYSNAAFLNLLQKCTDTTEKKFLIFLYEKATKGASLP